MTNHTRRIAAWSVAALVAIAVLAGCSGISVNADFDPAVNFAALRSYAWLPAGGERRSDDPRLDNSLLNQRIERAIDDALASKGFTKVAVDDADFLVTFHINVDQRLDVTTIPTAYGYRGRWGGGFGGMETRVDQYEQGTLLIDFVDKGKADLLWRGSGQTRLSEHRSPEDREKRVREVVAAILKQFPPRR